MTDFIELTTDLCTFATGIVAKGNQAFFERLKEELDFRITNYKSGSEYNGWVIGDQWEVKEATIHKNGKLIYDGKSNKYGVASYSRSFEGRLNLSELKDHVFSNPQFPDWNMWHCSWLYAPWNSNWGFSMPHNLIQELPEGEYEVKLITEFIPGEMLVADYDRKGDSDTTILFQSHSCHPFMANDGHSGTAVLIRFFQWLQKRESKYTYRLIVSPEHLGTIFYLRDLPKEEFSRFAFGVFPEMMGNEAPITIGSTFTGDSYIDRIINHLVKQYSTDPEFLPFRKTVGNDETVWEAPGYEIPFIQVNRTAKRGYPYDEYHSSMDTVDILNEEKLVEFYELFKMVFFVIENNAYMKRKFDGLLALSNPKYDLYIQRIDPSVKNSHDNAEESEKWGYLQDCVVRYFDGKTSILDIAEIHNIPFMEIFEYLKTFEDHDLIEFKDYEVSRPS